MRPSRLGVWVAGLLLIQPIHAGAPARDRDRAIGMLTQALQLSPGNEDVRRDLRQLLRDGFPVVAASETLDTLQKGLYENAWQRKEFEVPAPAPALPARACLTSGLLFSPVVPMRDPVRARLPLDQLEVGLRFNRACYAYLFDPTSATWRLRVRLFYVSESLIDVELRPLVEQLAQAFVQMVLVGRDEFGLRTRFAADEVVTVWVSHSGPARAEQHATAPGHLFFYSATTSRAPLEWLREVAHEYGHLALPSLGGFVKAEEPYATGHLGEALLLTRLALAPQTLGFSVPMAELKLLADRRRQAAMEAFRLAGPRAPLTDDTGEAGMSYLTAFAMHVLAQHGPLAMKELLATLSTAIGDTPVARTSDLFTAYEKWARAQEAITLNELATVAEGAPLMRWVFVPTTKFTLTLNPASEANAAGTISFLSGTTRLSTDGFVVNAGAETPLVIHGMLARSGWFQLLITINAGPKPVRVNGLRIAATRPP